RNGVTISGACETGLPITISGSGVAASSAATCTAGSYSSAITFSNGEGNKDVNVSQTDGAGNSGSASRTFVRDSIAPVVAITSPNAGTNGGTGLTVGGACETGLPVALSGDITSTSTACTAGAFSAAVEFSAGLG